MLRIIVLLGALAGAIFGYRHYYSPLPLQSHFMATVPVKLKLLPDPRVRSEGSDQISLEEVTTQKNSKDPLVLTAISLSTAFDTYDEQDILELALEDMDKLGAIIGQASRNKARVVRRGFIDYQGHKGYEVVYELDKNSGKEQMIQRVFTHDNHMLMLIASYEPSAQREATVENFFASLEFL
ncbi:hypothetical protein JYB88_15430 [Shewanella cyperi]|uniref:Uncharacterized protein n=1 Tax=Shewanella cyperi TaxID=2814292 RepID=A0A974XJK4_9GAMM|nr:hypothetical protein [Shewanella cyperi]QSX29569.1 hypothetical protein JYB88_15430 [Shewanella cyperi]